MKGFKANTNMGKKTRRPIKKNMPIGSIDVPIGSGFKRKPTVNTEFQGASPKAYAKLTGKFR